MTTCDIVLYLVYNVRNYYSSICKMTYCDLCLRRNIASLKGCLELSNELLKLYWVILYCLQQL